ncbi:MAG: sensor histidine kinase [Bdellovibrionales bacterium]|nr:sensor histidine kinase [Bdellovibrionales bacterium]
MSNKTKVMIILVAAILVTAILAGMRFASTVADHQKSQLKLQTENQVAFARQTLQVQVADLVRQLVNKVEEEASGLAPAQTPVRERKNLGEFVAVVWLGDRSQVTWVATKPGWAQRFSLAVFEKQREKIPLLAVKGKSVLWSRVTEENGRPLFAVMIETQSQEGGKGIAVGILGPQVFSDLGGFYKAQNTEFMIVDDRGFALAYSTPQYVGAQVLHHPAVELLMAQMSVSSSGESKSMEGTPSVFAYERLADSNLFVLLTSPIVDTQKFLPGSLLNLGAMALAICLLSAFFVFNLLRKQTLGFEVLKEAVQKLAAGQSFLLPDERHADLEPIRSDLMKLSGGGVVPAQPAVATAGSESKNDMASAVHVAPAPEIDKGAVLKEIGMGLVESLRPSMAAILGHAQLARSKAGDDDKLKQHFAVVERESRRVREVLENLERLVGEETGNLEKVDLQDTLLSVLASLRPVLQSKAVNLKKSLGDTAPVLVAPKSFRFAIEEIVHNAVAAMEATAKRELEIRTEVKGSNIVIGIKDSGRGIPREELSRVFDPFFTTQAREERSGLGLTMVKRILKSFRGDIQLSSNVGVGTEVKIILPVAGAERRVFNDEETMKILSPQKELDEMTLSSVLLDDSSGIKILEVQNHSPETRSTDYKSVVQAAVPQIEQLAPVTGNRADELPAGPSQDEVTFVGKVDHHDQVFSEFPSEDAAEIADVPEAGFSQVDLKKKTTDALIDDLLEDSGEEDKLTVQIRPPKIKV